MRKWIVWLSIAALAPITQAAVLTVTRNDDSGPGCFRHCLEMAEPGDEIRFDSALDGTPITLCAPLDLDRDVVIQGRGPDKTILRGAEMRVHATARFLDLTVSGEGITRTCGDGEVECHRGPVIVYGSAEFDGSVVRDHYMEVNSDLRAAVAVLAGVVNHGDLTVRRSAVTGNTLVGLGGWSCLWGNSVGIYNLGTLVVEDSELSDNRVMGRWMGSMAGGIVNGYWQEPQPGWSCAVRNSTISGNDARTVALFGACAIDNSTVLEAITAEHGGLGTVRNSVVSPYCVGYVSLGNNLDVRGTCGFDQPTDLRGLDPRIGPLEISFGPTRSHLPLVGSPLVDRGWCDSATDQRGVPRPVDGNGDNVAICDIGAVEYVPRCDTPDRPCDDRLDDIHMIGR